MSTDTIRTNIHFKIGESIREMESLLEQYRKDPSDTVTLNWIGAHAEYMAGLFADERKLESTVKALDKLNVRHG